MVPLGLPCSRCMLTYCMWSYTFSLLFRIQPLFISQNQQHRIQNHFQNRNFNTIFYRVGHLPLSYGTMIFLVQLFTLPIRATRIPAGSLGQRALIFIPRGALLSVKCVMLPIRDASRKEKSVWQKGFCLKFDRTCIDPSLGSCDIFSVSAWILPHVCDPTKVRSLTTEDFYDLSWGLKQVTSETITVDPNTTLVLGGHVYFCHFHTLVRTRAELVNLLHSFQARVY